MELLELSPDELAKAKALMESVKDDYVSELEAKGLPGKKGLEKMKKFAIK